MTDLGMRILEQYGIPFAILVALGVGSWVGFWRFAKMVGPTLKRWGDKLLDHWSENAKGEREFRERMLLLHGEHELADERRHAADIAHVTDQAGKNRHDARGAMHEIQLSLLEAIGREGRLTRAILTGLEDAGDLIVPKEKKPK